MFAAVFLGATSLHAQNVEFRQISAPAGIVDQTTYPIQGSQVSTVTAPLTASGYHFTHWTLNGVRQSYATGRAANPVSFTISEPALAVANYVLETQDSDGDGIPDWYEIHYFGNLDQTPSGDPDGDGLNNQAEVIRGSDPSARDFLVEGGISRRRAPVYTLDIPGPIDPSNQDLDHDGFIRRIEDFRGYLDTVYDRLEPGGTSRRRSPVFLAVPSGNHALLTELSSPAGILYQQRALPKGTTVNLSTAPASSNGYRFTGWLVNGVRVDRPTQAQPIAITVTVDTQVVARYIPESADTDGDGIPDWLEWYSYESLANSSSSDGDGDGLPWSLEQFRGYSVVARDDLAAGGVSRRRSTSLAVGSAGSVPYTMVSVPAGMVNQQGRVAAGTVITSPELNGSTNGNYRFVFWDVNGVRQTDPSGNSRTQIAFPVSGATVATAHYADATLDDDFDGLPDWYELAYYGTTTRNVTSDTDGDGISLAGEYARGYSPTARDRLVPGGVSRRRSLLHAVNVIQLSVAPYVIVNAPTEVTSTSAKLNALVNCVGLATTVYFEHGSTAAYGTSTAVQNIGSGSLPVTVNVPVSGLSPATVYHFRVVAENAKGVTTSPDFIFSTLWDATTPEGFEGASSAARWQMTGGAWQVGAPTSGPGDAFAGTNCAGTVLAGNYAANADSRLISPLLEVPASGDLPHLRFNHWWGFGTGDFGAVEIRQDTTGPWQTLATFTGNSGEWLEKSLDLSAFAGRRVQVSFRLKADNDASVGPGWYLDNVRLATGEIDEWLANTPDSFQSAADFWRHWTVTGTVWECGAPSSGPSSAHDGTTCAATNLSGNYPANADSRLVSPFVHVPSAENNPRFRFWHWFEFGSGDRGTLEVRELGSALWTELDAHTGSGGASWSKPSISLAEYAGKWVQLAFRIRSDNWDQRAGWYVDAAQFVTGAEVMNNPETFDGDIGDWYGDLAGLWQVGRPTSGPNAAHSGNNLAATNLAGNYPANTTARLESPEFQVGDPGFGRLTTLRFWHWYQFGSGDQGELQISVSDGTTWSDWVTLLTATGDSAGWRHDSADLTAYKGKTVRLGFLLSSNGDGSTGPGWYLDDLEITSLLLGQFNPATPVNNVLDESGVRHYYVLNVTTAGPLRLSLDLTGTGASTALYVRRFGLPTPGEYDYRAAALGASDQQLLIPFATPGTYYVMVHGADVRTASEYRLSAMNENLVVNSVSPAILDSRMSSVLTIDGAGFLSGMAVELLGSGAPISAATVDVSSISSARATFNANTVPAGRYSVRVTISGQTPVVVPDAVEFRSAGQAKLVANLVTPGSVGRNTTGTIWIEYRNQGDAPMVSPLLALSASAQSLLSLNQQSLSSGAWTSALPSGFGSNQQFFADPDGMLDPGESITVPVYFAGLRDNAATQVTFELGALLEGNTTLVGWDALKGQLRPANIPTEAWDIVFANFKTMAGTTWGGYASMLGQSRVYLRALNPSASSVTDIGSLLAHRFLIANGLCPVRSLASAVDAAMPAPGLPLVFGRTFPHGITERFALGALGRGWFHSWEIRAEIQSDGAVEVVGPGTSRRRFEPDSRQPGQFFTVSTGDHGSLRLQSGNYQLTEKDGTVYVFRSDLKLGYVEDTNANRITALYTATNLTSLTHSNGDSLTIAYYGNGRIQRVTDSLGRATAYEYDAAGEHLVKVTEYDGKITQYAYDTVVGSPSRHAIIGITSPDNTVRNYGYDARGWLASTARNGTAERVNFGYDGKGRVTATNALAKTTTYEFDDRGTVARIRNSLGQAVAMAYDADGNLVSLTDPAGRSHSYTYDGRGNLQRSVDPLGAATQFAYTTRFNRLARVTDANGNPTAYSYDARGNLKAITYADSSHEDWAYDSGGHAQSWTNRRGHAIAFQYDNAGRVTKKTYADNSEVTFTYDARGNLDLAVDPHGTTDLEYDANDRLTKITYPGNRWLQFAYDTAGRRVSSLDQLGHKLEYFYDALGRLWYMKDETGAEIVRYEYDEAGRMKKKTLGNGVYTTYDYDAAGQLLHLVNLKPDATVLSRFDYTYDSRGLRTEMDTVDGKWTYGYDDLGQLTRAVLDSTNPDIPDQDLTYVYDKLGNRVRTIESGVTTEYTTNNLNQYTKVGDTTYVFDKDGNLTEERKPGGTTVYSYNDENRLVEITSPDRTCGFIYDAFGWRTGGSENGVVTEYVIDPVGFGNVVGEYKLASSPTIYIHDVGLLGSRNGTQDLFYCFDGVGNSMQRVSSGLSVLATHQYSPFGQCLGSDKASGAGFVGRFGAESQLHNGLIMMRQRFFMPLLGRFVSPETGGSFDVNPYRYALNRPTAYVDPTGEAVWFALVAGAVYGAAEYGVLNLVINKEKFDWFKLTQKLSLGTATGGIWVLKGFTAVKALAAFTLNAAYSWLSGDQERSVEGNVLQAVADGALASTPGGNWRNTKRIGALITTKTGREFLWDSIKASVLSESLSRSIDQLEKKFVAIFVPRDPNDCIGPAGSGAANYVTADQLLPYRIRFENDASATAPAQSVVITDNLSPNLDWSTFRVTEIGFGDQIIAIPPNSQFFETQHACMVNGHDIVVDIYAGIDPGTGQAYCRLYTLDPVTGLPPAVDIGLLPPEDGTGRGKGWFSYTVRAKAGLPSGTEIRNVAQIKFDANDVIATNLVDPHDASKGTDPTKEALVTLFANAHAIAGGVLDPHLLPYYAGSGTVIAATGLPPGVRFAVVGGVPQLLGTPTKSGTYHVRLTIRPTTGANQVKLVDLVIEALPAWTQGAFTALIQPPATSSASLDGLGGLLSLNCTSTGAYSGSLRLGAKSYPVAGQIAGVAASLRGTDPLRSQTTVVTNPRVAAENVTLNLAFRPDDHATAPGLTGTLTYAGNQRPIGPGWQHVWNARTHPAFGNQDRTLNVALRNLNGIAGPQGEGFATIKLTKAGTATWTVTLADGRTLTGAFSTSPDGEVPFYAPILYPNGGSVVALLATETAATLLRVAESSEPNGRWIKLATTGTTVDRSYRTKFDASLSLRGAEYRVPASGRVLFGNPATPASLSVDFSGAGIGSSGQLPGGDPVALAAELRNGNAVVITQSDLPGALHIVPQFSAANGLLSGSVALSDAVGGPPISRALSYKGLYIPDLQNPDSSTVAGFFLLPALPVTGQAATATAIASGKVWVGRTLDFGLVRIGTTEVRRLRLANPGASPLEITSITCPSGFVTETVGLPLTLAAGDVRDVKVFFSPEAVQDYGGDIQIATSAGQQSWSCSGRGVAIPASLLNWSLGAVHLLLESIFADQGTVTTVTGLPRGVTFNATTQSLTGMPAAVGLYFLSFVIERPESAGRFALLLPVTVEALPAWAVGTFTARIDPPETAGSTLPGLGGYVNLTSTASGGCTGSLTLGARRWSFTGPIQSAAAVVRGTDPLRVNVTIITNNNDRTQNITLALALRPEEHATLPGLTGTLTFDNVSHPIQPGWQHLWNAKTHPAFGNQDRTLNVALHNSNATVGPQGEGFAQVKLTKSGTATWSVTLADGRKATGAFTASPDGEVPFYAAIPYPGGGALTALLTTESVSGGALLRVAAGTGPNGRWIKLATTNPATVDRTYRGGFDVNLDLSGAQFVPPARGSLLFGNLNPGPALTFDLSGGGIDSSGQLPGADPVILAAQLRAGNVIAVTQAGVPATVRFTPLFNASTGTLTGSVTLSDAVGGTPVPRTLSYNGLYIPGLATPAHSRITGFFLLPELPAPAANAATTDIRSGGLEVLAP